MSGHENGAYSLRANHDCLRDRCVNDGDLATDAEGEGYAAGLAGVGYDDCPYGHTHPDLRFSPWQRGRWKALGEWCDAHSQPLTWCEGNDDEVLGWDAEETPCHPFAKGDYPATGGEQ